jgi:uncharacterized protein YjbJ (UPF0337 family)
VDYGQGTVKGAVANEHAAGSKMLVTEGKVDQAKGAAHNAAGDVRDAVNRKN